MLPLLLRALEMDAGAVFVCRDTRAAELMAIHGSTHQRGYPYDGSRPDRSEDRAAGTAARLVELRPGDALQAALQAVREARLHLRRAGARPGRALGGRLPRRQQLTRRPSWSSTSPAP